MGNYYKAKQQRQRIAYENKEIFRNGFYVTDENKVELPDGYRKCVYIQEPGDREYEPCNRTQVTSVIGKPFETLAGLEDPKTAVILNFTSKTTPDGDLLEDNKTQEADLCRLSTLYASLKSESASPFYQSYAENSGCMPPVALLHSPNVSVFRNQDYSLKPEPIQTQVISVALPDMSEDAGTYFDELAELICTNLAGKASVVILGTWDHKPVVLAECMKEADWINRFKNAAGNVLLAFPDENCASQVLRILGLEDSLKKDEEPGSDDQISFEKGKTAWMVESQGTSATLWEKRKATVKSMGRKYVTVTDESGHTRKFINAERPILLGANTKSAFLVRSAVSAGKLLSALLADNRRDMRANETN